VLLAVCLDGFSNTTVKFDVIILNWHFSSGFHRFLGH
jgi:hypothetical protein